MSAGEPYATGPLGTTDKIDARRPDQLSVALAGALFDPDDADLPEIGAGPNQEPGSGAMSKERLNSLA